MTRGKNRYGFLWDPTVRQVIRRATKEEKQRAQNAVKHAIRTEYGVCKWIDNDHKYTSDPTMMKRIS